MAVVVQQVQECFFVTASGCLEGKDCLELKQVIAKARENCIRHVLVDCERITSVTTEALRIVLSQTTHAEANGINLLFYHVNTNLRETIDKTGLNSVLHIVLTLKEAYQYLKQHA